MEVNICDELTKTDFKDQSRFIVGGRSVETRQMIVMETCLGQVVDRPCDLDTNTHQTVCRQKYANHR